MQEWVKLLCLSALLIGSSCETPGNVKIYALLMHKEECDDFRGPGCYRYDDDCDLVEYLSLDQCHGHLTLTPDDANTLIELAEQCQKNP